MRWGERGNNKLPRVFGLGLDLVLGDDTLEHHVTTAVAQRSDLHDLLLRESLHQQIAGLGDAGVEDVHLVNMRALDAEEDHEAAGHPVRVLASAVCAEAVGHVLLKFVEHLRQHQRKVTKETKQRRKKGEKEGKRKKGEGYHQLVQTDNTPVDVSIGGEGLVLGGGRGVAQVGLALVLGLRLDHLLLLCKFVVLHAVVDDLLEGGFLQQLAERERDVLACLG